MIKSIFKKSFGFFKKTLLVFVVYAAFIGLFAHFISNDRPKNTIDPIKANREKIYQTINDPKLTEKKEGKLVIAAYKLAMCSLVGEACTDNPADADKNFKNSTFGFISNVITTPMTNPPASGVYWAYSGLQNAGIVPQTYAAEGIGFSNIKPFIGIWKIFRDLSYSVLVLVIVSIGFMVMFRMKLNPQTVITAENALPRIVIALVLITFSYAIAGFLIDLMYVSIAVIISLLSNGDQYYKAADFQRMYLTAGVGAIWDSLLPKTSTSNQFQYFTTAINPILSMILFQSGSAVAPIANKLGNLYDISSSILGILPDVIRNFIQLLGSLAAVLIATAMTNNFGNFTKIFNGVAVEGFTFGLNTGELPGTVANVLLFILFFGLIGFIAIPLILILVVLITTFFLFFRIFFMLLMSYVKILLLIFFAPVLILFSALPLKQNAFVYWLKSLIGEIITFPIVITLFLVANILANGLNQPSTSYWQPPFIYPINQSAIIFLFSMGLAFIIPDLMKLVKKTLGLESLPLNVGLGAFVAGGTAAFTGGLALGTQLHSIQAMAVGVQPGHGLFTGIWNKVRGGQSSHKTTSTTQTRSTSLGGNFGIPEGES